MNASGRRILVLDVCGTLYDANTTLGFCLHHHRRVGNRRRVVMLEAISRRRSPAWLLLAVLHRGTGIDLHRWLTIRSLRGEHRDALHLSASEYVDSLEQCRIQPVDDLVAGLRQDDPETVLVSNAVDIVIAEIAKRRNAPWLASALAFEGDTCSGRLTRDLTGRKGVALAEWLGGPLEGITLQVVTDNRSDADIIASAAEAWIVHKGPRKPWMEVSGARFIGH